MRRREWARRAPAAARPHRRPPGCAGLGSGALHWPSALHGRRRWLPPPQDRRRRFCWRTCGPSSWQSTATGGCDPSTGLRRAQVLAPAELCSRRAAAAGPARQALLHGRRPRGRRQRPWPGSPTPSTGLDDGGPTRRRARPDAAITSAGVPAEGARRRRVRDVLRAQHALPRRCRAPPTASPRLLASGVAQQRAGRGLPRRAGCAPGHVELDGRTRRRAAVATSGARPPEASRRCSGYAARVSPTCAVLDPAGPPRWSSRDVRRRARPTIEPGEPTARPATRRRGVSTGWALRLAEPAMLLSRARLSASRRHRGGSAQAQSWPSRRSSASSTVPS